MQHSTRPARPACGTRGPYVVGPLARYSLNHDRLPPDGPPGGRRGGARHDLPQPVPVHRRARRRAGGGLRGGAAHHRRLVRRRAPRRCRCRRARGSATGPRRHRAACSTTATSWRADGTVLDAQIVPPTSQNQASIELDLRDFVQARLELDPEELTRQCEQAIRNYDPCISCATHFLDLTVEER